MGVTFRLVIVSVFAILAFAGPLAWARNFGYQLANRIERQVKDQLIAAGKAEEAAQLSFNGRLQDVGIELPAADVNRLFFADVLMKLWWLWGLFVIGCSYGLFVILGWILPSAPSNLTANAPAP